MVRTRAQWRAGPAAIAVLGLMALGACADDDDGTSDAASASDSDSSNGTGNDEVDDGGDEEGSHDVSGSITLTIWGGETDREVFDERLALAKDALPDVEVNLIQIPEDYDTKVQTMFAGGEAPDVLMIAEGVHAFSSAGQLEDLAPHFVDSGNDPVATFGEGAVDTYSTEGSLWAAPDRSGAMVLYYNRDIFDAQGVDHPDGSWGWDEFRSAAAATTDRDGNSVEHFGFAAGDWWPWYLTFMYQNGGRVLDEDGTPVVDSPENVEALEFYNSLVYEDGSAPSPIDYADAGLSNGQPDPLFAQGRLAMVATGFWNVASLNDTDLNWDIAPVWKGREAATAAFGSGLAVASDSDNKDAAIELVLFLTSMEGQMPIVTSGLDVPANIDAMSSDAFQDPSWNVNDVNLGAFADSADAVYSPPIVPEWNEIQKAFSDGLDAVWMGEQSVADGLAAVQANLERVFE